MLADEEIRQTLAELKRVYQLNVGLLENLSATVMWIAQYSQETGTPVPNTEPLFRLMREAARLGEEIGLPLFPQHSFIKPLKRDVTKSYQNPRTFPAYFSVESLIRGFGHLNHI